MATAPIEAQITNVAGVTATPTAGSGHNYIELLNETVDPSTGSLTVRIGIPLPPGRKLTIPFSLVYNSGGAGTSLGASPDPSNPLGYYWTFSSGIGTTDGWSYGLPQLSRIVVQKNATRKEPDGSTNCAATTGYTFTDPTGATHSLELSNIYNLFKYDTSDGKYDLVTDACIDSGWGGLP